jgi:hypothetical protein
MRILVCGGRDYSNRAVVFAMLDKLNVGVVEICHGGARGADFLAGEWAKARGVPCTVFYAKWDTYGKRAGPIRNQQMLDEFKPDLTVAFPGGSGTADMVRRSRNFKTPVVEVIHEVTE